MGNVSTLIFKEHVVSYRVQFFYEQFNVNEACLFITDCLGKNKQIK